MGLRHRLVTISPCLGPLRRSRKGTEAKTDSPGHDMRPHQPYAYSRRVSLAASFIICLSIIAGSAAALAAIVPLT